MSVRPVLPETKTVVPTASRNLPTRATAAPRIQASPKAMPLDFKSARSWVSELQGQVSVRRGLTGDEDPITHLKIIASKEMRGRNSPSPGFDAACAYVRGLCVKYGAKGPNPADPQSPYYQTFQLFGFKGFDSYPESVPPNTSSFGPELFEHGFYVDDKLSSDDCHHILQQYLTKLKSGRVLDSEETPCLEDVRKIAEAQGQVQNVLALIEGTGPKKDEVVTVMCHLDHVGETSRSIYFGADDNGSGSSTVASLLPTVADLKARGLLNRSVLFVWTTAEEKGLVGSKYLKDHPIPGLKIDPNYVLNADMVGRLAPNHLSVLATDRNGKETLWRKVFAEANLRMTTPFEFVNEDVKNLVNRQDGANFPGSAFIFEGLSNPRGGGSMNPDYHQPTDTVENMIADNKGEKILRAREFLLNALLIVANRPAASETVEW